MLWYWLYGLSVILGDVEMQKQREAKIKSLTKQARKEGWPSREEYFMGQVDKLNSGVFYDKYRGIERDLAELRRVAEYDPVSFDKLDAFIRVHEAGWTEKARTESRKRIIAAELKKLRDGAGGDTRKVRKIASVMEVLLEQVGTSELELAGIDHRGVVAYAQYMFDDATTLCCERSGMSRKERLCELREYMLKHDIVADELVEHEEGVYRGRRCSEARLRELEDAPEQPRKYSQTTWSHDVVLSHEVVEKAERENEERRRVYALEHDLHVSEF